MEKKFKKIKKQIKKYNTIVIARHIGADPDALGSSLALRELIKLNYPNKRVYAIGNPAHRFKYMGSLDKIEEVEPHTLLIALDTPDVKRLDGVEIDKYERIIKIDHHPLVEHFGDVEIIDDSASSTCQLLIELIFKCRFIINDNIATNLYYGIVADTNRFLHDYTSVKTFLLVGKLLKKYRVDKDMAYLNLYSRPLNEIRLQGYIFENMEVTENGVAFVKINDDMMKEYGVDSASAGNMINDLNYINEVLVWVFFSEDVKSNLIRANIRSRGPSINELASNYGGGGHKYASGARLSSFEQSDDMIKDLDLLVKEYVNKHQ